MYWDNHASPLVIVVLCCLVWLGGPGLTLCYLLPYINPYAIGVLSCLLGLHSSNQAPSSLQVVVPRIN
ncbi:hypothetical protein HETIRDRAFT_166522 [Heterobasidion irregulare TC 32-1]|uniref:Uncharacterized protein n=1 Tax=Heterobasidion irregulare (strain TC 32-1) TaxID=747525 RepID=W4KMR6_HETIT|nr:uncharacterized protein HETIRDRAFT_166522 [Heterobasidion irregulare TC 32-1]ETW86999.1 hypothetical protein HETIRDRAFT_166522 [Heterobasidion irregulare TC 32-1]